MPLKRFGQSVVVVCFLGSAAAYGDWLTFNHDPQRTGWAVEESKLSPQTAGDLQLRWSVQLENVPLALNALTAPLVARDVPTAGGAKTLVYVAGSSNHLFAVDAASGQIAWQRTFQSFVQPKTDAFFLCPNAINATPVIDRRQGLIFALASDGRLYGLDLGTGNVKFGPFQFVPPFAKPWSLNLSQGFVYTTTSQNCGGDRSGIYAMQVDEPGRHVSYETLTRAGSGAGMWDRGGPAVGANGVVYVSTGDGAFAPEHGDYGSSFVAASTPALNILDYYSPANRNEVNKRDLDLPSGGDLLFAYRHFNLLAGGGKEGVVYLLDADALGDRDHQTALSISPRIGNDAGSFENEGIWGTPALWKDEAGTPWIYVPLWGEPSRDAKAHAIANGPAPHGAVVAFRLEMDSATKTPCLKLAWISPDVNLPDAPTVANGVVFVVATGENPRQVKVEKTEFKNEKEWKDNLLTNEERAQGTQGAALIALDAKTGKLLGKGGTAMKTWNHFGGMAIDDGLVFTVDHSSTLYCYGLSAH